MIIGIGISFVLGGLIGWAADHFYNRGDKMVIHPLLCIIFGVVGGVLGSWAVGSLFSGGFKALLVQVGAGAAGALLLLLLIGLFGMGDDY